MGRQAPLSHIRLSPYSVRLSDRSKDPIATAATSPAVVNSLLAELDGHLSPALSFTLNSDRAFFRIYKEGCHEKKTHHLL